MTDPPRPERDLDPAALDELSRAFADHQRDRAPEGAVEARQESAADDPAEDPADDRGDGLAPTAPTPVLFGRDEPDEPEPEPAELMGAGCGTNALPISSRLLTHPTTSRMNRHLNRSVIDAAGVDAS